jgi:hypothetical protein
VSPDGAGVRPPAQAVAPHLLRLCSPAELRLELLALLDEADILVKGRQGSAGVRLLVRVAQRPTQQRRLLLLLLQLQPSVGQRLRQLLGVIHVMTGPLALAPRVFHCIEVSGARRRQLRRQLADERCEGRVGHAPV